MSIWNDRIKFSRPSVSSEGISPLRTAVDALLNYVRPEKQRALRRYLGRVNYYHRFIPHCAAKPTPLNTLLTAANKEQTRSSLKSNFNLCWTECTNLAFIESKQMLPSKHEALAHCSAKVGPSSTTLAQRQLNNGPTPRVF